MSVYAGVQLDQGITPVRGNCCDGPADGSYKCLPIAGEDLIVNSALPLAINCTGWIDTDCELRPADHSDERKANGLVARKLMLPSRLPPRRRLQRDRVELASEDIAAARLSLVCSAACEQRAIQGDKYAGSHGVDATVA